MSKGQRILTFCLWSLLLVTMVGVVAAKLLLPPLQHADPPGVLFPAAHFVLTDENNAAFSSDSLRGKPYIVSFMFTKCAGICPKMNIVLKGLNADLPADFQFVSFTVDPANDDPKTLKSYAQALAADEMRWHFLTGDIKQLKEVAEGMKLTYMDWPTGHSARLLLVDGEGNVRGSYLSNEPEAVKKLVEDAKAIQQAGGGARS